MAKRITKAQKTKIWTKTSEIVMAEKHLRDLVRWVSGQESTKELTKHQGILLIDILEGKTSSPPPNPLRRGLALHPRKGGKIMARFDRYATPDQIFLIETLKKEAEWDNEHLMNFIRKIFNKDTLDKLGDNEAGVVITVLKRAKEKRLKEETHVLS